MVVHDKWKTLLTKLPKGAVCAEVGVWKGDFSRQIIERLEPRELQLIDPWRFSPEFPNRWYGGAVAKCQEDMDRIFHRVERFGEAHPQIGILRKPSIEGAKAFSAGHFDWVYIDGSHSYCDVLDDLRAWSTKVRRGGLLAGDDFNWRDEENAFSVRNAVLEFANERGLPLEFVEHNQFILRLRQ